MKIKIRRATEEDASLIADLGARTYRETYSKLIHVDDIEPRIEYRYGLNQQVLEIKEKNSFHYICEVDGSPCGFMSLKTIAPSIEHKMKNPIKLDRIYILKQFQSMGIGTLLLNTALEAANEVGASDMWLGVLSENESALQFYEKFGFDQIGEEPVVIASGVYKYILFARSTLMA